LYITAYIAINRIASSQVRAFFFSQYLGIEHVVEADLGGLNSTSS
jgi:hypothetical protein